ncbi:MAG: hypothetical protein RJA70_332 [Pseudomonadota bacterium]|jgi:ATP-binding cassette subfamily B protein
MSEASARTSRIEKILREFHEDASFGKAYDLRLLRRLWQFVYPHRRLLYWSLILGVVTVGFGLVRPLLMQWTIDSGVLAKDANVLLVGAASFAGVTLIEQLLTVVRTLATQRLGAVAVSDLRSHVFAFLHRLRLGYFDGQPVGRLVTRVTNDTDALMELASSGVLNIATDLLKLIGIVVLMLTLDWQLSIVAFLAVPPVMILVQVVRRYHREAFREIRAKTSRMNANMNEQVSGMPVVQAFSRQEAAAEDFDKINQAFREANIRSIKYDAMQDAAIDTVTAICVAFILLALGFHPVSFGVLVAFIAYVREFFEPISLLAQRYTILQSSMAGAERIFALLEVKEFDAPETTPAADSPGDTVISLEGVDFSYKPGVPVLHDVSLFARRGEKIALVGPTGSGKTTIASLLLRLYDVQAGVVRVNGRDVKSFSRDELRRHFAAVPQDVFLFPGTVADNIAAGEKPDLERVEEVLLRISALELFKDRPEGLLANVEERGSNFSAGERQLIAFARALYRDAPVLILDEATASIDSDTEAHLQTALNELMKDRTAIIIAHRLSTIQAADRIIVLHKGRVAEQGTHEALLAGQGLYAKLHALHFSRPR